MNSKNENLTKKQFTSSYEENLSESVLFTFTPKLDYLLTLIEKGITPRFVYERLPGTKLSYIIPMKCFCDIPLGKIKRHIGRYGNYGLGIKKSFLQKIGVSPVIYVHQNSESFFKFKKTTTEELAKIPFLPLLKRYYGDDYYIEPETLKVERKRIRFYDEREWRFIPIGTKPDTSNQFQTIEKGAIFVQQMNFDQNIEYPSIQIPFEEIEYIIIGKKKETAEMVKQLRLKFGRPGMERLIPKLISAESIINDF
jgi:hypothetical protein